MKFKYLLVAGLLCLARISAIYCQETHDSSSPKELVHRENFHSLSAITPASKTITGSIIKIVPDNSATISRIEIINGEYTDLNKIPARFIGRIENKIRLSGRRLTKSTCRYLDKVIGVEKRMQKRLAATDSATSNELFTDAIDSLLALKRLLLAGDNVAGSFSTDYNAYLDSLSGGLAFMKSVGQSLQKGKNDLQHPSENNLQLATLKNKIRSTDAIHQYLREQKETLSSYLQDHHLTALGGKEWQRFSKNIYYYSQQYEEWKETFSNAGKLESKVMGFLRQLPLFKQFMQEHSELAALLNTPESYGSNISGLQTRNDVMKQVTQRFGNEGAGMQQMINGQLGEARAQLQKLKDKFPLLNSSAEMPDFKPSDLKTKTILQRIEFGGAFGFSPHNTLLPTLADLELQAGYKVNKKGIAGIGASYKVGFGREIGHIRFSHQGFSIKSFIDWHLAKANLHINGGLEYHYLAALNSGYVQSNSLIAINPWQTAALLGISKKIKTGRQNNKQLMILYDFLHAQHYPATEAVKFSVGYSF